MKIGSVLKSLNFIKKRAKLYEINWYKNNSYKSFKKILIITTVTYIAKLKIKLYKVFYKTYFKKVKIFFTNVIVFLDNSEKGHLK